MLGHGLNPICIPSGIVMRTVIVGVTAAEGALDLLSL